MNMALQEVEFEWPAVCEEDRSDVTLPDCDKMIYTVFAEMIESPLLGEYCGFGISVTDAQGRCICTVHDVTCEREQLEGLVCLCNRNNLSFCHLYDVIEDFLS